jgi:hypothetical protein
MVSQFMSGARIVPVRSAWVGGEGLNVRNISRAGGALPVLRSNTAEGDELG